MDIEDLLKPLKRRSSCEKNIASHRTKTVVSLAHALLTKSKLESCVFCLSSHRYDDCRRVDNKDNCQRKELLGKYSRCFKCLMARFHSGKFSSDKKISFVLNLLNLSAQEKFSLVEIGHLARNLFIL